jgi:RHS repeat-associated protein
LLADEQVHSLTNAANNDTLWALADHLGTVRDAVDNAGKLRLHRGYDAFGNVLDETHYNASGSTVTAGQTGYVDEAFSYTGRWFDKATGLQNNLNRWYNPKTGRWMSEDPIGFEAGDANLYRYVGNSPTTHIDPTGQDLVVPGDELGPEPDWPMPDGSGRSHDIIPRVIPENWGKETLEEALEDARKSIENRLKEMQKHGGGDAKHWKRVKEEQTWQKKLEERLKKYGPAACVLAGIAIVGGTIVEDICTGGGGVADDPACFIIGGRLVCQGFK